MKAECPTIPVIGLPLAVTDYAGAVAQIFGMARRGDRAYAVAAANTHLAALSRRDAEFGASMARFDLVVPDGMPLVWVMNRRLLGDRRLDDRVYGPNLMLECLKAGDGSADIRHFLLGGMPQTLEKLRNRFANDLPGASIAGAHSPPFGPWPDEEFGRVCGMIRESRANIVWVGLGCPKQEHWIARHIDHLPPAVYLGIGAAFAFHAGEVPQAPRWMQRRGMEWLFRMVSEPQRLLKRYLVHNTLFLYFLVRDGVVKNSASGGGRP